MTEASTGPLIDLMQPQAVVWLFMAAAMLLQWLPRLRLSGAGRHSLTDTAAVSWLLLGAAVGSALWFALLQWTTLCGLLLLLALLRWCRGRGGYWLVLMHLLAVSACLALSLHLIPGFHNWLVLSQVQAGADSALWSMYLNLDKPLALFILVYMLPELNQHQARLTLTGWQPATAAVSVAEWLRWGLLLLLSITALSALALSADFIRPELKLPTWWWLFLLNNLLLTCLVEEAFFRGYLQRQLQQKFGPLIAVVLVSSLFGLAHLAGGWLYALLATVAGLLYGLIYLHSGRLWLAVLAHALLNFSHLCLFTYPWPLTR
jgi:hypothetical protein